MVSYPLSALKESSAIGGVTICAQHPSELAPVAAASAGSTVSLRESSATIAQTIEQLLRERPGPLLVTTADHVLLTSEMVDHFAAAAAGRDLGVGMVSRQVLVQAGIDTHRTWLKFRGGHWSGANLFWLKGAECIPLIRFWAEIEQDRKKGFRIISAFGPGLALAAALRLGDVHSLVKRAGRRFGIDAAVIAMPQAEACIDADKPSDIALIEQLLAERAG